MYNISGGKNEKKWKKKILNIKFAEKMEKVFEK